MKGAVGRGMGVWGEVRKDVWGVEKCGKGGETGEQCVPLEWEI